MAPLYDFLCSDCGELTEEFHSMSGVPRESTCPTCGGSSSQSITDRSFTMPNGWSDGKTIFQLHPNDPLRHVESESQMVEAYDKAGISMDTGESDGTGKFERRTNYFHSKRKPSKARSKRKTK